jgi:MoxR-like ATPase
MARIFVTQGEHKGRDIELVGKEMIIGRDPKCAFPLNDDEVSRHHAKLYCENGAWQLADLDSANGTTVNDRAVTVVALRANDVVSIGATTFLFMDGAEPAAAPAAAPDRSDAQPEPKPAPAPEAARPGMMATADDLKLVEQMRQSMDAIRQEVGKVIVGQDDVLNEILMCIIAGGHALLIGLPGLAKTLTVSTISKVLDMKFKRIQFTPDLMPSDITGTEVLETDRVTQQKEFRFMQGPVFCNLLLADEINRTPPKTQAALLEAMQEKQVSVGKDVYKLDKPFFVLATQNPIEQEGTYPLPEAQLDRFMFNIFVDYPKRDEEITVITRTTMSGGVEPQVVIDKKAVIHLQEVVRKIPVSEHVIGYAVNLVRATRPTDPEAPEFIKKYVSTGAGPRAGQFLVLAAKARAVLEGRIHVSCNDIRSAAMPVLRHRILTNFAADSEGLKSVDIVTRLLSEVKEPGAETYQPEKAAKKK